jgi:hypothetical protein
MAIKKSILAFIMVGICAGLYAQSDTSKISYLGAFFIVPVEFPIIDNTALNNELSGLGFPKCEHSAASIGMGLQLFMDRWVTSFSYVSGTKENEADYYSTKIDYYSLSFWLGYDLTKNLNHSVYPAVGLKICGLNYLYQDRLRDATSFSKYFNSVLEYREIDNSKINLDLGIGTSLYDLWFINVRAGFLVPLNNGIVSIANSNGTELFNSPAVNYKYYLTLAIGLGKPTTDKRKIKQTMGF